jgi:hypothetical protein
MCWLEVLRDIGINCLSSFLFVGFLGLLLWLSYRKELAEAKQFFGFGRQTQVRTYISAHEDKQTASKRVVTAIEYEAAAELKNALQELSGREFIRRIAGLIGQDPKLPEPVIEVSPLEEVKAQPSFDSLILIGGPLRNQVTRLYSEKGPLLKYDTAQSAYLELVGGSYQKVKDSNVVAILVKMAIEGQTVFFAFGDDEEHTRSAVRHLIANWRELSKRYPNCSIGICLSVDQNGKAKAQKILT